MKKMNLFIALLIAMPLFAQAKVISCKGEDRGGIGIKLWAKGNMKEVSAYGHFFAVGDFNFKVTEPGKPVWEITLPISISLSPTTGSATLNDNSGYYIYQDPRDEDRQLDIADLLSRGSYVSYRSPAINGRPVHSVLIDVRCTGFSGNF